MPKIDVTGSIYGGESLKSPGDGAYDLCGTWEVEEFVELLRKYLSRGVKPLLGSHAGGDCGFVLRIDIYDGGNAPK